MREKADKFSSFIAYIMKNLDPITSWKNYDFLEKKHYRVCASLSGLSELLKSNSY